jgi:hypothetical protein
VKVTFGLHTLGAQASDNHMIQIGPERVILKQMVSQFVQMKVAQSLDSTAATADQVVMGRLASDLVHGAPLDFCGNDQAQLT